ncbi:MAG: hypothetical protein R6X16_12910 [Anaerolineae bacterium]
MSVTVLELPFEHLGRQGVIEVRYGPNTSAVRTGFDALGALGFDPAMCLGYPTLRARVKRYAGSGYRASLAWIQLILSQRYTRLDDLQPATSDTDLDVSPQMLSLGVPFFAHGYPAVLYDAPCNNLGDDARLDWLAHTFLVTFPSRLNNDTVTMLAGFSWGYREWDKGGARHVWLRGPEPLQVSAWEAILPVLRSQCPAWHYL